MIAIEEQAPARPAPGQPAGPNTLVIFGATGDLTKRKLIPALLNLKRDKLLPEHFSVIGLARTPMSDDGFRTRMAEDLAKLKVDTNTPEWKWLAPRLFYLSGDLSHPATYQALRDRLGACDRDLATAGNYLFYLSTAPDFFGVAARQLSDAGLTNEQDGHWRRVIVEKPFGRDFTSARLLNSELRDVLKERQIYRIDHYLGKETVQNLIVFRFTNGIIEPLWNRRYVDHIQITVAETVGVERRGGYYDTAGAMRDMMPNHLFQLLSLVGMEPPASLDAESVRDEQVKFLRSLRPMTPADVARNVVRAQYAAGEADGQHVPGYREEEGVNPSSQTETYVALKLEVDNWRWASVPFYLRTGKRLAQRHSEIVVQYRQAPYQLFRGTTISACQTNRLVINVQPAEGLSLRVGVKIPGPVMRLAAVTMEFDYSKEFGKRSHSGYERLLYECMLGDATLFQRGDMAELSWGALVPVQQAWAAGSPPMASYPAGSWGPQEAKDLLGRDGRTWSEDDACGVTW